MEEQRQQLMRRITAQVLERAEADPQWRQQYLDDPQTAMATIQEARQLQELYESTRTAEQPREEAPPAFVEESAQVSRSLAEKVLDKAASDPA